MLQVDRDAAFVEIEKREQPAAILDARAMRPQLASAFSRHWLDLDDVGAHVRQQLRRIRTRDEMCQIDDANVAEPSHRARGTRVSRRRSSASILLCRSPHVHDFEFQLDRSEKIEGVVAARSERELDLDRGPSRIQRRASAPIAECGINLLVSLDVERHVMQARLVNLEWMVQLRLPDVERVPLDSLILTVSRPPVRLSSKIPPTV